MISSILTSEPVLSLLAAGFTTLIGWLGRKLLKNYDQAKFDKNFAVAVNIAYFAVNEVARRTPSQVDDKVALGLEYLKKSLAASDVTLTQAAVEKARAVFEAMHAREKAGLDPRLPL